MAQMMSFNTGPMGPMGPSGEVDQSLIDYVDILFNLMGVEITYDRFKNMTGWERKQFLRDLKINKIINE